MRRTVASLAVAGLMLVSLTGSAAAATPTPRLGTALASLVIGGSTVTNTGPTEIHGGLALAPGSAVTGFPPGHFSAFQIDTANARAQKHDLTTAFNDAANAVTTRSLTGVDLGNLVLTPGVYAFSSSAELTGTLTLRGRGVFIFKIGSALTTASSSRVLVTGGANSCSVWWKVGSSATLGSGTSFQGNLMALTSITAVHGTRVTGRLLARNGAVTLDDNVILPPSGGCSPPTGTPKLTAQPPRSSGSATAAKPGAPSAPSTGAELPLVPGLVLVLGGTVMVLAARRRAAHRR